MPPRFAPADHDDATLNSDLDFHASGFIVHVEGSCTDASLAQFRQYLQARRLSPTESELAAAVEKARREYQGADPRLYICGERPCRAGARLVSAIARTRRSLTTSLTGCQGFCKKAPVMALRVGGRSQIFADVMTSHDRSAVLEFAEAAMDAGSLLVPSGDAGRLFYDPDHPREQPGKPLKPLMFLVGRFRGEGRYADSPYRFRKEVVGTYEAGGRFIALRMDASYPTADGREDVHKALVIVGADPSTGTITGRAYTDGGVIHEYFVERNDKALRFADAPPDHSEDWAKARKYLEPTEDGFEERLEVDTGDGFKTYYAISMRRLNAA